MPRVSGRRNRNAGHLIGTLGAEDRRHGANPTRIAAEMPECVYVCRTPDDLVKIGYTRNLNQRIRGFGARWQDVLLVVSADMAYEKALHRRFAKYLARGAEYYFPTIEIMAWVNEERGLLGVPAA